MAYPIGGDFARKPRKRARQKLVYAPIDTLRPYANNARIHPPKQLGAVTKSIQQFEFIGVVVAERNGTIIAGHLRVEAAKAAGLTEVPVIYVDHLTEAQTRAFILADNRLAELASTSKEIVASELVEIGLLDPDFDLTTTGFDATYIDLAVDAATGRSDNREDAVPPLQPRAVTRLGDLWLLGDHKLYCGDATQRSSYLSLMSRERARMILSDPPFNLPINGFVSGKGRIKHREFVQASGEMSEAEFIRFLFSVLSLFAEFSRDGSLHYLFIDHRHLFEMITACCMVYDEQKSLIVWAKTNAGLGSMYRSQHELILLFKKGVAAHINNIELGKHGRNRSNLWTYAGANSFSSTREEELGWHSTVKPLALVADAILDASRRGNVVLDGFGGSGTTLIAAEQTGRRARLLELDPLYCDVILRRFESKTGRTAILAASGASFAQVTADRLGEASHG